MSTVTQRIPNLLLGISQQPDNRKFPGQVKDAVNVYPDYALGLLKRPGGKFISELEGASSGGKWFSILRDQNEKYIAQYDDNVFRVWSLFDGSPRAVDMGTNTGVPGTCNIATVKSTVANYNTAKAVTATRLTELNAAQATYSEVLAGQEVTQQELFQVAQNYPSGNVEEYLVSGILLNAAGIYLVKNNNVVISSATTLPAGYTIASEVTNEHPLIASNGYKIYIASLEVAATHDAAELAAALAAMGTAQTNYDNAVSDEAAKLALYEAAVADCAITTIPATGYLKDATPADIELLTLNDYTFVLNKNKQVALKATTSPAKPNEAFVVVKVVGTGHYRIKLDGVERATYNAGSGGDVDAIITDLASDIDGQTFDGKTYTAVVVGPGIYISCTAAFTIDVVGGPFENALFAFQESTASVNDLPISCKDGYVVRIVNSSDINVDDMYVQFVSDGGATYGVGVWEETVAPGIQYEFDELTMPHQLVRQADGSFTFGPAVWEDRIVGDAETNPNPSFVGTTISNLFFYRNRLGMVSNESIVLSRAGDYFNFWATTALTVTDDDPIDISASATKPVFLKHVQPTSVGLVLFGETEQFLLTTDSDILSPKTSKINTLSSYDCDGTVASISLGTTIGFISKSTLYTNLLELYDINNSAPPLMYDQTKIVPELIPQTIDSMIASPALSLISMATTGSDTIYQYRFFQQGSDRKASTWYKWKMTGTVLDQFFDSSTFYAITTDGTNVSVVSLELTQSDEAGLLTLPTGERTDVCLDMWNVNPYRSYTSGTDTTRVYLPFDHISGKTISVLVLGGYIGGSGGATAESVGAILYPTVQGASGAYYVDIDGDYRGRNLLIGYIYDMEVVLPKFYVVTSKTDSSSSDYTSNLILHRLQVSTGLSGPVKYKINITGISEWNNVIEAPQPYNYELNNVTLTAEAIHTVPIYQRNNNLSVSIIGDTPFPVSILGIDWEGRYNDKFYQRR